MVFMGKVDICFLSTFLFLVCPVTPTKAHVGLASIILLGI